MTQSLTNGFNGQNAPPGGEAVKVYSHGELAGELTIIGNYRKDWKWQSAGTPAARLLEDGRPGEMPFFLEVLQPEGWLADTLLKGVPKDPGYLRAGIRYLSNLLIVDGNNRLLDGVALDKHEMHLDAYTGDDGVFRGRYSGPAADKISGAMEEQIAALWKSPVMPKFSGAQIKIPMSLLPDGVLTVANPTPFTHILKLPGDGHFQSLGAVEWMGLELSETAGLETAKHALLDMPCDMPPAVLVERFDIPEKHDDENRRIVIADFCTIGRLDPESYKREINDKKCIDILKKSSSNPGKDLEALFKRLTFACLIGDYDAHLKNLSVVKEMDARTPDNVTTRFSPAYDTITTTVFMPNDRRLSVCIGGAYDDVSLEQLASLGKKCGLDKEEARRQVLDMASAIAFKAAALANDPPTVIQKYPECALALKLAATDIIDNARKLGAKVPEWEAVRPDARRMADIRAYFDKKEGKVYRPVHRPDRSPNP